MRRLEQARLAAEDRATIAKRFAAIVFGSLCLMLVAGLGYWVARGEQSSVKTAAITTPSSARTTPAQQLGMLVIWASMTATDW
jgi:hypothetical protein